jgi:hypothetical protein
MDFISLTRSLAVCCKQLYLFFKKVRDGDPAVVGLWKEIEHLERTVEQIKRIAETSHLDGTSFGYYTSLESVLRECQQTINAVFAQLGRPNSDQSKDVLQKIWRQCKHNMNVDAIQALQSRVAWTHRALGIALQTHQMYTSSC